jgi:hypothetical protein
MSSQGTGSAVHGLEDQLLQAWGVWGRSGSLGLGYQRVELLKRAPLGTIFSESALVAADRTVASLATYHRRVIVTTYLHCDSRYDGRQIADAVAAFVEAYYET